MTMHIFADSVSPQRSDQNSRVQACRKVMRSKTTRQLCILNPCLHRRQHNDTATDARGIKINVQCIV
jgi:hypothetical protein